MNDSAVFAGLSGLKLDGEFFDLGQGVTVRSVYSHVMAPFLIALTKAEPGKHHPGPWKNIDGGLQYELTAELCVPERTPRDHEATLRTAKTVVFLLRLGIDPAVTAPVFSTHSFADPSGVLEASTRILPYEILPRFLQLQGPEAFLNTETARWVTDNWQTVERLSKDSAEFSLAREAIDQGQFVENQALALISLWSALEALFSPSQTELRFRVSSLMATFLEPAGNSRLQLQKRLAVLYDKRSAAAHGKPKHQQQDLVDTFNVLRDVLLKIIERGSVPSKDSLEAAMFGV
ncbi:hypothetical protein ACW5EG_07815 [Luteimonas sp. A611]